MIQIDTNNSLYPEKLKRIPNPPKTLYLEGNLNLLQSPTISIIGSRSCSENGIKLTKKFASELSQLGITIVSGLAKRY